MRSILLFTSWLLVLPIMAQPLTTVFESSNGNATATYPQVIDYYRQLADTEAMISLKEMGMTDSGQPLHLVILDPEGQFDFEKAREQGKTVILINNGIHPGEPDGIEACMMLLRNYARNKENQKWIENALIAVIPVYNIGGALQRNSFSRANQNGPDEYGFRGNARNFDLNRDFVKADTKNTKSFYEIFHFVRPSIFIDTHVSNGADYQYSITHLATQHNKMGGEMGKYIEEEFTPQLEMIMQEKGSDITPYVNVFNTTPDSNGFSQFLDDPRYSTGYTTLFHTLGFMIETHMLKKFDRRVKATYDFLEAVLMIAHEEGTKINTLRQDQAKRFKAGAQHALSWRLSKSKFKPIEFKGYQGEMIPSKVTGQERLLYGRNKPFTKEIPYYNHYVPGVEVVIPKAYIIPQGWHRVIDRLKWNQVEYERISQDTSITVEVYKITKYNTGSSPYEGHYRHHSVQTTVSTERVDFLKGDYVFYVDQFAGRYLVETLEPKAVDSFFSWNFFDTILQQKEYFSPYVFEDVAEQLLRRNASLRTEFEAKKKINSEFANDWYAQLDFIYKHSEYYEKAHLTYPVYRLRE